MQIYNMKNNSLLTSGPKHIFRIKIEFPKEMNISSETVREANLPSQNGSKWNDINIQFIDFIFNSNSKTFFNLMKKQCSFLNKIKRIFLKKGISFCFEIKIVDSTNTVVEIWKVNVEKIKSVDYGVLLYTNEKIDTVQKINVSLKIKSCELIQILN